MVKAGIEQQLEELDEDDRLSKVPNHPRAGTHLIHSQEPPELSMHA